MSITFMPATTSPDASAVLARFTIVFAPNALILRFAVVLVVPVAALMIYIAPVV